jgi:hypothetical protein
VTSRMANSNPHSFNLSTFPKLYRCIEVILHSAHSKNFKMAQTEDLRVTNLFSVKGYVCVVTGGGKFSIAIETKLYLKMNRFWDWSDGCSDSRC